MSGIGARTAGARAFAATAAGALAIVLAAGSGISGCGGRKEAGPGPAPRAAVSGVPVEAAIPADRERRVEAVGTVRARNIASVASQVMGRVTRVLVSEGSRVAGGSLLAVLDDAAVSAQIASADGSVAEAERAKAEADAAVAQAEAGKALAEKTHARFARLLEERVVAQQEFDEVEARRTVAVRDHERAVERRSQLEARIVQAKGQALAARTMLSYTKIAAPFDGVVTGKTIEPGSMAVPGVPLFTVEDVRRHRIEAFVPESYIGTLRVGAPVEVLLDAFPGKVVSATVSEVVPAVDAASRTFTVKADLQAPGLRTGLSGRIRFAAGKAKVMTLPRTAIVRAGGYDGAFVVTPDNVARLTLVRTGEAFGDRVEILSGIDPGARVATGALDRLADGVRVEVRE